MDFLQTGRSLPEIANALNRSKKKCSHEIRRNPVEGESDPLNL